MSGLSSVNLLWEQRLRGLMPVTAHNVADGGHTLLIRHDRGARTYQVLCIAPGGGSGEPGSLSVETVQKFDGLPGGRLLLGMTNDDLYLFREGRKLRFLEDRRLAYADACLAPEPGWLVCGFSDALFSAHGIAFGDVNGRLGWTKELESQVNRVAAARDGRTLAVGLQNGRVLALDNSRASLWVSDQREAISALVMPGSGPRPVAGTEGGSLIAFDEQGGIRWRHPVALPILAVAVDRHASGVAIVASDGSAHLLACFGGDGHLAWEQELLERPTGVSLSPSGQFLALSTAAGTASFFAVDFAAARSLTVGTRRERELKEARAALAGGERERARRLFLRLLEEAPHDVEIARELQSLDQQLVEACRADAGRLASEDRWEEAFRSLEPALAVRPWSADLLEEARGYRQKALVALADRAGAREADRDWEGARTAWSAALALDAAWLEARQALARIRKARARELRELGDRCREAGKTGEALSAWQEALALDPDEALRARLHGLEVERCMAAGIAHYEAGRTAEAVFQFTKALALDPGHAEATRYLGYARDTGEESLIADRFSRLE